MIERLADTIQIDELAERLGIKVKRTGGRALAQCVFHNDTNPSMALYPGSARDKSHYHCYVCDEHGDIFELVKKVVGGDFISAVNWLASTYGFTATTTTPTPKSKKQRTTDTPSIAPATNSSALEFGLSIYSSKKSTFLGDWLVKRSLSNKISADAELCAAEPRDLVRFLEEKYQDYGLFRDSLGQLESVGLVRSNHKKSEGTAAATYLDLGRQYRDFFFDARVIFPVRDERNRLVGFAGRKINEQSLSPKYLYSPNLPKSQVLYRAHKAFQTVGAALALGENPVIYICEGLLDALRLEALGFAAVAVLGSRLSDNQARLILDFANTFPELRPLQVRFFLDLDGPGLKGTASSIELAIKLDKEIRLEMGFVWPMDPSAISLKDPDELLKPYSDKMKASAYLDQSTHPIAVALLAEKLNIQPGDILEDEKWESIPLGAKYRISLLLEQTAGGLISRLLQTENASLPTDKKWHSDVLHYLKTPKQKSAANVVALSRQEAALQLNLAREIARSGSNKGEVLSDVAGWRRMALAATAFNEGFTSRLKQAQFQPIEPFDAIHVSRGFGKSEERLKAMPCSEDLVIQQYVMNELLTERLDDGTEKRFSNFIPAVRYYRSLKRWRTTGETEGTENNKTLSFAYQIDMDVLEGRHPPGDSGMFRPYFDCWKDFISSLLTQGREMDQVHMVRLDFKRYYDRIKRTIVKDLLQSSVAAGYQSLEEKSKFVPLFQPKNLESERQNAAVDFLLEQSFGYIYFDPESGAPKKSDRECGIPQGPVLSAWLGNIVLFRLDAVIRSKLELLNNDGVIKAGYARYVDDVILLGDSVEILSTLRAATEDVARTLQLEVLAKENFAPMSRAEFSEHLTSGRALAASGPREEPILLESGDGDAGWGMLGLDTPRRQSSLELLRDPRLYTLPPETIQNQIFTALRAEDLRPSELSKAARWLWYQAAHEMNGENYDASAIVRCYWRIWHAVCANAPFVLNPAIAWDDPVFYALEGLESLFERANSNEFSLTPEEGIRRTRTIAKLAQVASSLAFVHMLENFDDANAPSGWGRGAVQLRRMFFQRIICMQWKAVRLADDSQDTKHQNASVQKMLENLSSELQGSLKRSLITDAETWQLSGTTTAVSAHGENDRNPLADSFLWLHRAVVAFGVADYESTVEPLAGYKSELEQIENRLNDIKVRYFSVIGDKFLPILKGLLCPEVVADVDAEVDVYEDTVEDNDQNRIFGEVLLLSLQTLAAITPRNHLAHILASRRHLFQDEGAKLPLPPLPGIPANGLLLISPTDTDKPWTKISTIWWITLSNTDPTQGSALPSFKAASAGGTVREILPNWVRQSNVGKLEVFKAAWDMANEPSFAFAHAPVLRVSPIDLAWIADAFEAIARLNHSNTPAANGQLMEYVPAWPYIVTSVRPDIQDTKPSMFTLLTTCYPAPFIDGIAFVSHGIRGLTTYDIPETYARHWRVGVLLSDLFGFQRDLDQYAALTVPDLADKDGHVTLEPAEHLLRNVLRKLRGSFAQGMILKAQSGDEHIPATILRSLNLLRGFPRDGELKQSIAYVLSSEAETAAMHIRLAGNVALEYNGVAAAYAVRVALRVVTRVPLGWAESFESPLNDAIALPTSRVIPSSYFELSRKFESLLVHKTSAEIRDRGFSMVVAGLRIAAISAWLREITLSIDAMDSPEEWSLPTDGDVASAWQIEEKGFLFSQPDEAVTSLTDFFLKCTSDSSTQRDFTEITPLGWLVLLAGRVGLLGKITKRTLVRQWNNEDEAVTKALAEQLSAAALSRSVVEDDIHPDWPFEFENLNVLDLWLAPALCTLTSGIAQIESNIGLRLLHQRKASWRFNPTDCSFVDSEGEKWEIKPWQIILSSGAKPERIKVGRRLLNIWDETRDRTGNLVLVAARDDRLSKLLGYVSFSEVDDSVHVSPRFVDQLSVAPGAENIQVPQPNLLSVDTPGESGDPTDKVDHRKVPTQPNLVTPKEDKQATESEHYEKTRRQWRSLQEQSWKNRRSRSPGHVRIAIMQWNLDETYHHPVIDSDKWDDNGNWPPDGPLSPFENSAIEFRRQKLISEVLNACENFEVDLLVLPEYSVRPDTVKWLREQLHRRIGMPSVLAGTYKIHGNSGDDGFEEVHKEILGLSDYQKTLGTATLPKSGQSSYYSSGEHSSMLTLLAPLELNEGKKVVCSFTRRKKYPSLAAAEVFNPNLDAIRPLYSAEGLLSELLARAMDGSRVPNGMPISPQAILSYTKKLRKLEFLTEFVCSELFLPMSVSNHHVLAMELQKLARRFGSEMSVDHAKQSVIEDVELMANYLGFVDPNGDMTRRSILIVPAMTTRSVDYWVFGQAALLSGGTTTVFCNAVKKKYSVGGSCFIGRNSWIEGAKSIHQDTLITPYAGWSKGIYYHQKSDALGTNEQAVVIADIDPSFMHEGKPRPQALAVPLQLVAYLPIAEVEGQTADDFCSKMTSSIQRLNVSSMVGRVVEPAEPALECVKALIAKQFMSDEDNFYSDRYEHWKKYWRINPTAGVPAAFVDWLWIDSSTTEFDSVKVFVPSCAGDPPVPLNSNPDGNCPELGSD